MNGSQKTSDDISNIAYAIELAAFRQNFADLLIAVSINPEAALSEPGEIHGRGTPVRIHVYASTQFGHV